MGPPAPSSGRPSSRVLPSHAPDLSVTHRPGGDRRHLPDPARSRILLIGCAGYLDLPGLPAVRENLEAVAGTLTDRFIGGFSPDTLTVILNARDPQSVAGILRDQARAAQDTFLVYFAGHGLLTRSGELHLALAEATAGEVMEYDSLAYKEIKQAIEESPATHRVLILDCCFAGNAGPTVADPAGRITRQLPIAACQVLMSAPDTSPGVFPAAGRDGGRYTALTGALLENLRRGIPDGPELFTLAELHPRLRRTLTARNLPPPLQHGEDDAAGLALTRNPAVLRAGRLPPSVAAAITSPYPVLRSAAACTLGDLLAERDVELAYAGYLALDRLAADDPDPDVVREARRRLRGTRNPRPTEPPPGLRDRWRSIARRADRAAHRARWVLVLITVILLPLAVSTVVRAARVSRSPARSVVIAPDRPDDRPHRTPTPAGDRSVRMSLC